MRERKCRDPARTLKDFKNSEHEITGTRHVQLADTGIVP